MRHTPARRQHDARRGLRLRVRLAEGAAGAHDLAGRLHLRAEDRIGVGNLMNGNTDFLHREVRRHDLADTPCSLELVPAMTRAAIFASGTPVALDTNGTVRDARGFTSRT